MSGLTKDIVQDAGISYVTGGVNASGSGQVTSKQGFGYLTLTLDPSAVFGSVLFGTNGNALTPLVPGVPDTAPYTDVSTVVLATGSGSVGAGVAWALRR